MSNTIVSGQISVKIGTANITLTTADISASPKVFSLPEGESIDIQLADLNSYLNTNFGIPQITFPGIAETTLSISKFLISSAGLFDLAVSFVFGAGQGWEVFPGFTLNTVGFEVNYAKLPVLTSLTPNTGAVNTNVVVAGNDLGTPTKVAFGTVDADLTKITNPLATSFTIPVPANVPAGVVAVAVTNADGTSNTLNFTVS